MQLFEQDTPPMAIDYQKLQNALEHGPEATNDFSSLLAINSAEHFDQFNELMKDNCSRLVSWPRTLKLLDELNRERIQVEQAQSNQAAW